MCAHCSLLFNLLKYFVWATTRCMMFVHVVEWSGQANKQIHHLIALVGRVMSTLVAVSGVHCYWLCRLLHSGSQNFLLSSHWTLVPDQRLPISSLPWRSLCPQHLWAASLGPMWGHTVAFRFICVGTDVKTSFSVSALVLELCSVDGPDLELEAVFPALHSECWASRPVYTAWLGFYHSGRRDWLKSFVQKPCPCLSFLRATYLCQSNLLKFTLMYWKSSVTYTS